MKILLLFLYLGAAGQTDPPVPHEKKEKILALIKDLEGKDIEKRIGAATALAEYGSLAQAAVPGLVKALEEKDDDLRLNAAIALGKIGKAAVAPVGKLLAAIDADTRYHALAVLGWVGPPAKEFVPQV